MPFRGAFTRHRFENAFEESIGRVATAMALSAPDLVDAERFAMKVNLGT